MNVLETETAQDLFDSFISAKKKLIADKKIMDKKDKHIYPIKNTAFSIPEGWVWCFLSDVSIIQEGPGIRKYQYENEGVQFLTVTNILEGSVDLNKSKKYISNSEYFNKYEHFTINKGDIVTACSGGSWGKSSLYNLDDKIILNTSTLRLRFFNDLGDNKYLYYLTKTSYFKGNLSSHSTGQQANYGYSHYSKIPIPLPTLSEQKQIVIIIDQAFEAIDTAKANAEQNLQNAKELFASYLQNVFENKGDDWENKPLSEVCDLIKRGSQPKYTESESGEIVLNQKCIRDHKINLSVARKHDTNKKTINKERYIQLGDGLINSTGTGTLGRVAQVRALNFSAFVDTHITIVRPKKDVFYLDFFGWALIYIEKIIEKSGEGASGQTELSRKLVEKLVVSFPEKMKQQEQIVLKLDALSSECKKLEAIYIQKIADLEEMKKSVLQKAFSGQLNTIN